MANQARIWLVVSPNHGLPLLLGSVATIALLTHYAVLSHSTWVSDFFQGGHKKSAAVETTIAPVAYLPENVTIK